MKKLQKVIVLFLPLVLFFAPLNIGYAKENTPEISPFNITRYLRTGVVRYIVGNAPNMIYYQERGFHGYLTHYYTQGYNVCYQGYLYPQNGPVPMSFDELIK